MDRIIKSIKQGVVGGIAGLIVEHGLQMLTGTDFIDGVLEIAGVSLGIANANRDLIEQAYDTVKTRLDKEPKDVSQEEWDDLRKEYPKVVDYLEKALSS
ncbi:hypothetical protein ACFL7D_10000 [candidate division KSB1 bacterium]